MCRALKVLCAAPDHERLLQLKRATVSVNWELVGGATSVNELVNQVDGSAPDVVVIDAQLGAGAATPVRDRRPNVRIVSVGALIQDADAMAEPDAIREAILGIPTVGGPVRN